MGWHEEHRAVVAERMASKIKQEGEELTRRYLQQGGWSDIDIEYIIKKAKATNEKEH